MSARKQRPEPTEDRLRTPNLREQLRPVELLGIAAVIGVFVGLVSLMATREPILAVIMFGIAFIVVLVVLAMFVLGFKPDSAEEEDLAEQNAESAQRAAERDAAAQRDSGAGSTDAGPTDAGPTDADQTDARGDSAADGTASAQPNPHD